MFCYKCGATMADQAAVCPQCGAAVQNAAPATAPVAAPQPQQPAQPGSYAASSYTPQPQESEGKATASLILGILAVTCFGFVAGIPAVILGHMAKSNIRKSNGRLAGDGKATAGLVMGYISVALIPLILIITAIAIPNLLRARIAANESAAASSVRVVNTAQVTYSVTYPQSGYALSLAVLGPGTPAVSCDDSTKIDAYHACLIDSTLGCSSAGWCYKNGYRYHINAICGASGCTEYVITATPVSSGTGIRSFCSTSDAVIRFRSAGRSLMEPLDSAEACQRWAPIM